MNTPQDTRTERVAHYFAALTRASVAALPDHYTPDAYFKDPFNEVRGVDEVRKIFEHMYEALHEPHFVISETITQADACFITWDFKFRFKRFDSQTVQTVRGCSHLRFAADGRVSYHRDYWDAAEELYEKLPLVGTLMRWLKKRTNS